MKLVSFQRFFVFPSSRITMVNLFSFLRKSFTCDLTYVHKNAESCLVEPKFMYC